MKLIIGKICFLSEDEGGQKKLPKEMISTPAIFDDDKDQKYGLWSMNVYLITMFDENREAQARFRFLVNNSPETPHHLLYVGSKFDLIGTRTVARCLITEIIEDTV